MHRRIWRFAPNGVNPKQALVIDARVTSYFSITGELYDVVPLDDRKRDIDSCDALLRDYDGPGLGEQMLRSVSRSSAAPDEELPQWWPLSDVMQPCLVGPAGHVLKLARAGAIHDAIAEIDPDFQQLIDLHLSSTDGRPLYAEENGLYWLAGMVGGIGQQTHGGNGAFAKTPDRCAELLASHCRFSVDDAWRVASEVVAECERKPDPTSHVPTRPSDVWRTICHRMEERWRSEAEAAMAKYFLHDTEEA